MHKVEICGAYARENVSGRGVSAGEVDEQRIGWGGKSLSNLQAIHVTLKSSSRRIAPVAICDTEKVYAQHKT